MTSKILDWVNSTPERQRTYAQESLIVDVTEEIWGALESAGISQAELASKLGKSKAYVSQLLNGSRNMTLRTLADISHVMGFEVCVKLMDRNCASAWRTVDAVVGNLQRVSVPELNGSNDSDWSDVLEIQPQTADLRITGKAA